MAAVADLGEGVRVVGGCDQKQVKKFRTPVCYCVVKCSVCVGQCYLAYIDVNMFCMLAYEYLHLL